MAAMGTLAIDHLRDAACDVGIAQACQPSPVSAIARVTVPKI